MSRKTYVNKTKKTENCDIDFTATTVNALSTLKLELKHKNEKQKKFTQAIKTNDVIICTGPSGSGKTYLSVGMAIKLLKEEQYKKIVLIKSVTTLKTEEIGFIKGSIQDKMEPFMYSFINNFEKLIGKENTSNLRENGYIETLPIAYLRGINIDNSIILVDEVQNISHDNLKTILTRLGENSKIILLGDTEQVDIKYKKESSLIKLVEKIKKVPSESVSLTEFNEEDIVRHKLTSYFINLFKEEEDYISNIPSKSKNIKVKESLKWSVLKWFKYLKK